MIYWSPAGLPLSYRLVTTWLQLGCYHLATTEEMYQKQCNVLLPPTTRAQYNATRLSLATTTTWPPLKRCKDLNTSPPDPTPAPPSTLNDKITSLLIINQLTFPIYCTSYHKHHILSPPPKHDRRVLYFTLLRIKQFVLYYWAINYFFIIVIALVYGLDSRNQLNGEYRIGGCLHIASYNNNTAVACRGPLYDAID